MHLNNGSCSSCLSIFNRYPFFNLDLQNWFKGIQKQFPDAHISCAGRGHLDQETLYQRGATRAHYGESAHNYNAALDVFQQQGAEALWDIEWFDWVIGANLTQDLEWYGAPKSVFYELPHIQIKAWRTMKDSGLIKLVE